MGSIVIWILGGTGHKLSFSCFWRVKDIWFYDCPKRKKKDLSSDHGIFDTNYIFWKYKFPKNILVQLINFCEGNIQFSRYFIF
jgi:hypothetical protein